MRHELTRAMSAGAETLTLSANRSSLDLRAIWFIFGLAILECFWAFFAGIRIDQGAESAILIALPLALGLLLEALGVATRWARALHFFGLWLAWMILGCFLSYLAASFAFPLQDETFASLDAWLGFDWLLYYRWIDSRPALNQLLIIAYLSMLPQVAVAIVYFSRQDRTLYGEELWWSTMTAIIATCLISGVLPALDAWEHHKTDQHLNIHISHLLAIREGTLLVLPIMSLKAIVTFPSFHAAMAVLLTYPYRRSKLLPVVVGLNSLMLASIPKHGGHYLVDIFAGAAVAIFSIVFVKKFLEMRGKQASRLFSADPRLYSAR